MRGLRPEEDCGAAVSDLLAFDVRGCGGSRAGERSVVMIPPPAAFGLPEKFTGWRPEQERAIFEILDAEERFVTACLPTGTGKSLIPPALAKIQDLRCVILTSTKNLQDQYRREFGDLMADLRGRANYKCMALMPGGEFHSPETADLTPSVDHGPCHSNVTCSLRDQGCEYYDAVRAARNSQLVVTNYSKWLTADIERELGKFDMLVLDEAHAAADELAGSLSTELEYWEVETLLGSHWPGTGRGAVKAKDRLTMYDWGVWAGTQAQKARTKIDQLGEELRNSNGRSRRQTLLELRNLRSVEKKLQRIAQARGQWCVDDLIKITAKGMQRAAGVRFDPVWPAPYAEEKLFRHTPKVLLTSATIRPKSLDILGIPEEQSRFIEYPSSFPVIRRPVTFVPTVRMSHKATDMDLEKLIDRIDEIIESRSDRRIIIHTVSYARRNLIMTHSSWREKMISHESNAQDTKEAIERFKTSPVPVILVSPSVSTGVDFPYEAAEVCIIVKVPFPDLRSKVLKARVASDKEYGNYLAAQELVQMAGRGMRAQDDRFETIIIDSHAGWFVYANRHLFPKHFMNAFRKSLNGVPKPLPKL